MVNIADPMRTPWAEFIKRHTECARIRAALAACRPR